MAESVESLSQGESANRLRITTAWVRELTKRGILSRNADGSYPWPLIDDEYRAFQARHGNTDDATPADYKAELARLTREKADAQEMENRVRRGELQEVRVGDAMIRETLEAGDRALKSAPRKLAKRWARRLKVTEPVAIELIEQVVEEVRSILRRLGENGDDASAA